MQTGEDLGDTNDSTGDQWSQELQLTYEGERLAGVAGAYYFEEEYDDIVTVELNPPPPGIQLDSDNTDVANDNWALFTQWTYDLTDQLSVTVGGAERGAAALFPPSVPGAARGASGEAAPLTERALEGVGTFETQRELDVD